MDSLHAGEAFREAAASRPTADAQLQQALIIYDRFREVGDKSPNLMTCAKVAVWYRTSAVLREAIDRVFREVPHRRPENPGAYAMKAIEQTIEEKGNGANLDVELPRDLCRLIGRWNARGGRPR